MTKKNETKKTEEKKVPGSDIAKIPTYEEAGLVLSPKGAIQQFDPIRHLPSIEKLAKIFMSSGLMPSGVDSFAKAVTIMIKSHELEISYLTALEHLHVVKGKASMSAQLMRSFIIERCPGSAIDIKVMTPKLCAIVTRRPGQKVKEFTFSYEEAAKIKDSKSGKLLVDKDNWRNYPADMLLARCTSRMGRGYYPDIIRGVSYTPEELGAATNEAGEYISTGEEMPDETPTVTIEKEEKTLNKKASRLLGKMEEHYGEGSDDIIVAALKSATRTIESPEDDSVSSFFDLTEHMAETAFFRWKSSLLLERMVEVFGTQEKAMKYAKEATANFEKDIPGVDNIHQVNNRTVYGILKSRFEADIKDGLFDKSDEGK